MTNAKDLKYVPLEDDILYEPYNLLKRVLREYSKQEQENPN